MLLSGIPQTSASSPQLSLNASLPDSCIAPCFSDLDSPCEQSSYLFVCGMFVTLRNRAFGPCGVELMAHIAQRLFSSHALVAQAMEVNSTTAHPVDVAAVRADMQPAAADTLATKVRCTVAPGLLSAFALPTLYYYCFTVPACYCTSHC
jgi:hypothetical protein